MAGAMESVFVLLAFEECEIEKEQIALGPRPTCSVTSWRKVSLVAHISL